MIFDNHNAAHFTANDYSSLFMKVIGLLVLLSPFVLQARTEEEGDKSFFSITPRSCLIKEEAIQCERDVVVNWRFQTPTSFCLLIDNGFILFCENNQTTGHKILSSRLRKTTHFEVVEQGSQRKLSTLRIGFG